MNRGFTVFDLIVLIGLILIFSGIVTIRIEQSGDTKTECYVEESGWSASHKVQSHKRTYFDCEDFTQLKFAE